MSGQQGNGQKGYRAPNDKQVAYTLEADAEALAMQLSRLQVQKGMDPTADIEGAARNVFTVGLPILGNKKFLAYYTFSVGWERSEEVDRKGVLMSLDGAENLQLASLDEITPHLRHIKDGLEAQIEALGATPITKNHKNRPQEPATVAVIAEQS